MLRQVVFEGVASFLFVFFTLLTTNAMTKSMFYDQSLAIAVVLGSQYAIFYYIGNKISAGVLNPATSLGLAFTKKISVVEVG